MSDDPRTTDILGLPFDRLGDFLRSKGLGTTRQKLLFATLHRTNVRSLDDVKGIHRDFLCALRHHAHIARLDLTDQERSPTEPPTSKLVLSTRDGHRVETVLLPRRDGNSTVCLSTQVGCKMGCLFCRTGQCGFARDLTAGEIVAQVRHAIAASPSDRPPTHLVFMGMGEPLDNYDATMSAYRVFNDTRALGFGKDDITISTCGHVPGIGRLGREGMRISLAVSLNATTDAVRDTLMPINRQWPLSDLVGALATFPLRPGRTLVVEYVLIDGVNDDLDDARRLKTLLSGIPVKVNLIRLNPIPGLAMRPSPEDRVRAFANELERFSRGVLIRASLGGPISAACGQLAHLAHEDDA